MIKSLGYTVMVRRANYWGNGHHQTSEPGEYMYAHSMPIASRALMQTHAATRLAPSPATLAETSRVAV